MKKILVFMVAGFIAFSTACGKKEENKEENKDNTQNNSPVVETTPENEIDLTESDLAKIENVIDTTPVDEDTTAIAITYTNKSEKDYEVKKIKFTATKEKEELFSVTKEFNDIVKPGETKEFKFEVDIRVEEIASEDINLSWEMVG